MPERGHKVLLTTHEEEEAAEEEEAEAAGGEARGRASQTPKVVRLRA